MTVRVGVLGAGTVGGALVNRLLSDRDAIRLKSGVDLELRRVAVRDLAKERAFDIKPDRMTDDALSVVTDPSIDVIVEVMGGLEPAGTLVLAALRSGKPVVTANKELIATRGEEIVEAAKRAGVSVMYEAAVGGGIPVIRPLAESLAGEDIDVVSGIVNGTTNYILTAMAKEGRSYDDALAEAQRLGYAETDPADDVSGRDAAFKTSILASLAFGERVAPWEVECEGIEGVTAEDVASATEKGEVIKLIGSAQRGIDGRVEARCQANEPARRPPAGRGQRGDQRHLHRGAVGGPTPVHRARRRGSANGQRHARRSDPGRIKGPWAEDRFGARSQAETSGAAPLGACLARQEVAVPGPTRLDRARHGLEIDPHDPEALVVATRPLEVVHQGPEEVAAHIDTSIDRHLHQPRYDAARTRSDRGRRSIRRGPLRRRRRRRSHRS